MHHSLRKMGNIPLGNNTRTVYISVDLEGSGGRKQALNGVCEIGAAGYTENGELLFERLWKVHALGGIDDPTQVQGFWGEHPARWAEINAGRRDRLEVAREIREQVTELRGRGWRVVLLCRPVGYDFRELTTFFQTLGVELLARNPAFQRGELSWQQVLQQICCAYDIFGPEPTYYDTRNDMESPFGFGGGSQVIDIAQSLDGCLYVLCPTRPAGFNKLLEKYLQSECNRTELTHDALQDAKDQAAVWFRVKLAIDAYRVLDKSVRGSLLTQQPVEPALLEQWTAAYRKLESLV
jgi:hypothetical protein